MLKVYKGYEKEYLETIKEKALVKNSVEEKLHIVDYSKTSEEVIQKLALNLTILKEEDLWITYEEFSVCNEALIQLAKTLTINIEINNNNKYYNAYPVQCEDITNIEAIFEKQNMENDTQEEDSIYSYVYNLTGEYYVQYHNYEYDYADYITIKERYIADEYIENSSEVDYIFDINEDTENFIKNIIEVDKYQNIAIAANLETEIIKEIKRNLIAYLKNTGKNVTRYIDKNEKEEKIETFKYIAREVIGIPDFKEFKKINFYKNPEESNELIQISQADIINEITNQIDNAKKSEENTPKYYRDIFITAPTGAGKSVMFQIPAIYAAQKYESMTIVISPLVELMNDQVYNLQQRGYYKAARINSDINVIERQEIIQKIEEKEIDIVYISPEALLSYSIESIIGSREISAIIIDEAHIVTTWGQGFRPDYWYLGTYIERLRKSRYKKGMLDTKSKRYDFPVCTFTATSVYGGEDDGVREIAKSLYLVDPIRYIGEVKRNDIKFDINVIDKNMSKAETEQEKSIKLQERIDKWSKDDEKSLVYFPYNSIATDAYYANGNFENIAKLKDKIGIYTGQFDKSVKKYDAEKYKKGEKNIMFATKAFGMGIDIKDIKHVYHYAPSGNLNDYLQEIGRAARAKEITGYAHMDYFEKDLNYSKTLFGMSAIKQYHIDAMLRILNNVYKQNKKRNMLITPQMFETVFPKNKNLENAVKTALLNIEKDMLAHYRIPVIITRPRSIFTTAYAVVDARIEEELLSSEFGKYFKRIQDGRKSEKENGVEVTDLGAIYNVNLKGIWEEKFSKLTFQNFKYYYYSERDRIFGEYAEYIYPRNKIEIEMVDGDTALGIKEKLMDNINKVSEILSKFQNTQGEFTQEEFEEELLKVYKDRVLCKNISYAYFKCIEDDNRRDYRNIFYTSKVINNVTKYKILNSNYRSIAESLIYKSYFLKEINQINSGKIIKYKNNKQETIKPILKILNLLSLFNLVQYDMYGGENPEIFVRINEPNRIRKIVEGSINYNNGIVLRAAEKHKRDNEIFNKFIKELKTDDQRWDYIERYFLGHDVLNENINTTFE